MLNEVERRKQDKFDREDAFIVENAADFPAGSDVAALTAEINVERDKISAFDAAQESGQADKRSARTIYEQKRDEVIDLLDLAELAAEIVEDDIPGTAARFRNNYPRPDQVLVTRCTQFYDDSEAIKTEMAAAGFVKAKRDRLPLVRDEFNQAAVAFDTGEERRAEAKGGIRDSFRKSMEFSKRRDKRVRMKYRDNPAKLAAWTVASHLDRAPKRAKNDSTSNPTPPNS